MSKLHIKKGDTVMVISGEDKGHSGRVLEVLVKEQRAIVEGLNMIKKHAKRQESSGWNHIKGSSYTYFQPECCRSQNRKGNSHWPSSQ